MEVPIRFLVDLSPVHEQVIADLEAFLKASSDRQESCDISKAQLDQIC